ncbi:hypothetical protein BVAVS116_H0030 (plasmid) [Borreliella valaisiana VS116]|uniref:Uncharacterized protein n=1 Tax=Borreliella valaisiana VS116 TaxID=445987 RepID=C0R987_BORVA|nr:hypothetical protein BVAVS116_H0030 [Borreliella valaisiana VS116]
MSLSSIYAIKNILEIKKIDSSSMIAKICLLISLPDTLNFLSYDLHTFPFGSMP